jgi:ketosteroid isomerase-like protein
VSATDPRLLRIVAYFERLKRADLARLGEVYATDARFKDPFNEVQGLEAIARVFEHMFASTDEARFVVHDHLCEGTSCLLTWDFHYRLRGATQTGRTIRGATHLRLGADGRIVEHRDYWDAAEEVYETVPVLGAFMRWLKRRASAR